MQSKYRITYPQIEAERVDFVNKDEVFKSFLYSNTCFVLYEDEFFVNHLLFSGLDEYMLTNLIVVMNQHSELFNFLKTAVIATENFKKGKNKAISLHKDAEDYVRKYSNFEIQKLKADEENRLCSPHPKVNEYFQRHDDRERSKGGSV